nr:hypothetical protein [Methanobrevibacter arboriphilus]
MNKKIVYESAKNMALSSLKDNNKKSFSCKRRSRNWKICSSY